MSKYTVSSTMNNEYFITNGQFPGAGLYLRRDPDDESNDGFANPDLHPLCPFIRSAKTVAEAQAIVDGVVKVGPYTVDFKDRDSIEVTGYEGGLVTYSPCSLTYTHTSGDPLATKVCRAKTLSEILTILKESLVSKPKTFTAVAPQSYSPSIRIQNGHKEREYLYLGYYNAESATRCVVPELAGVIDALNTAPTVAVAQAIIDAHINAEAKVSVTVKVTEEFTVTKDENGDIEVDGGTWYHAVGYSNIDSSKPFAALFTKLDEAAPTTVAEAVAIIKEFNRANS